MLNVIELSVIKFSVVMVTVIILNVAVLSVIVLGVIMQGSIMLSDYSLCIDAQNCYTYGHCAECLSYKVTIVIGLSVVVLNVLAPPHEFNCKKGEKKDMKEKETEKESLDRILLA